MPFTLEVTFRGLCLFVRHPEGGRVAVVLPDARATLNPVIFADGERGEPHVGFLRGDLHDVAGTDGATGDFVHRFARETLDFVATRSVSHAPALALPDVGCFARGLRPVAGTFDDRPPASVLMRAVLEGGQFEAAEGAAWTMPTLAGHDAPGEACGGQFAQHVVWRTGVEADELAVRFRRWDGAPAAPLRLRPRPGEGVLRLEIANLCAVNPLGWRELGPVPGVPDTRDDDFRWFYQILETEDGRPPTVHAGGGKLPVPHLADESKGRPPGCLSAQVTAAF